MKIVLLFMSLLVVAGLHGQNLLRNGELNLNGKSMPSGWQACRQEYKQISSGLPDNVMQGIQVRINKELKGHGYIVQYIKPIQPNSMYKLTGWLKSSVPRQAYIQIKFIKNGKEVKRIGSRRSQVAWQNVSLDVNSYGADQAAVLCRFMQAKENVGQTAAFADLKLIRAKHGELPAIIIVGDSTVANYKEESPLRGWGQMIGNFFNDKVRIINHARSGKSTKTFITQKYWDKTRQDIRKGDFVFIQFGHNDSHAKDRPESTDAQTDYKQYLKRYIDETRKLGAFPVLVTPMHRRVFHRDGRISQSLKPYADAMKEVAAEKQVECIDLFLLSEQVLTELGEKASAPLFCSEKDRTHFSAKGATLMAELITKTIREKELPLKKNLK